MQHTLAVEVKPVAIDTTLVRKRPNVNMKHKFGLHSSATLSVLDTWKKNTFAFHHDSVN